MADPELNPNEPPDPPADPPGAPPAPPPAEPPKPPAKNGSIAKGGEEPPPPEPKTYWPEDWRQKAAAYRGGDDERAVAKELKRLERIADPAALYGMYRELESWRSQSGLVKIPGKDATEDEIAAYRKAMNVPEKPEDYFSKIELANGATIGEQDKPVVDSFAAAAHEIGAPPEFVNAALNWYFSNEEAQAAALDQADDDFYKDSTRTLKDEWGQKYDRYRNSVLPLFASAPGGTDVGAEGSLFNRLMAGRMADGRKIGDDPEMIKWLVSVATEINPISTVTESGHQSGKAVDAEIAEIEKFMRENRREYFKDQAKQDRYKELIDARNKYQARESAR